MNPNKRRSKRPVEDILRARLMLATGMLQKDVGAAIGVGEQSICNLKQNKQWADVQVPVIRTTHPAPKPGQPWDLRIEKIPAMVADHCAGCGKMLFDGLDKLIYLVSDDLYVCDQKCLEALKGKL
jgi:hypothetical protein